MYIPIGVCSALGSTLSSPNGPSHLLNASAKFLYPSSNSCKLTALQILNARLSETVSVVLQSDKIPLVVGGDHSIAAGTWPGVYGHYKKPIGLLWVDAHLDGHSYETSPTKNFHGMPLGYLLGHGDFSLNTRNIPRLIDPKNVCIIGARSFEKEEKAFLEDVGVTIFYGDQLEDFSYVLSKAYEIVNHGTVGYGVSFDFDALQPIYAPGVSTPVSGGINTDQAHQILSLFDRPLAIEFVEYHPENDQGNTTYRIAKEILHAYLVEETTTCST